MKEIFMDIKGYEGSYQVSNLGNIRNNKGRIMKQRKDRYGYMRISFRKDGNLKTYYVHRLVLQAFKANPDNKPHVNHLDENKENNNLNNLAWSTAAENNSWGTKNSRANETKRKNGVFDKLAKNNNLNPPKKVLCITTGKVYESAHDAARDLNLNNSAITQCCKGKYKRTKGYQFKYYDEEVDTHE